MPEPDVLLAWTAAPFKPLAGQVVFYSNAQALLSHESISFEAGQCVGYREDFDAGTDDHVYTNKAGIPTIDIYHYNSPDNFFPPYHHATTDNMAIIDRRTLKAVGQTMTQALFVD